MIFSRIDFGVSKITGIYYFIDSGLLGFEVILKDNRI